MDKKRIDTLISEINEHYTAGLDTRQHRLLLDRYLEGDIMNDKPNKTYTVTVFGTTLICRNIEAESPEDACKQVEDNWVDIDVETEYSDCGGYEAELDNDGNC